jgi:hypothetical protein
MLPLKAAALALVLTVFTPQQADACDAVITAASPTLQFDYDPFTFGKTVARAAFEIENRDATACEVDLLIVDAKHMAVSETVIDASGVVASFAVIAGDVPAIANTQPGIWRIRLDPNKRAKMFIDSLVTQDAIATAGMHVSELTVEVRDPGAPATRSAPMPLHVALAVKPRAQMNIVGAAGTFGTGVSVSQVDFGTLASKLTRRVFLQVRANTSARLTIDSAHLGRLMREGGGDGEEGIAYAAELAGASVDLRQHYEQKIDPPHSLEGESLPLDLSLGDVGPNIAGQYSDVLTLVLSAL